MVLEVGLKLASTAGDLWQLEQALLNMSGDRPAERTTLTSTYYDTAAGKLKRNGLVLQVQKHNGKYVQTVTEKTRGGKRPSRAVIGKMSSRASARICVRPTAVVICRKR